MFTPESEFFLLSQDFEAAVKNYCTFIFSRVHATLQPALSVRRSVRPSVRRSVRPSHFTFLYYNVNS